MVAVILKWRVGSGTAVTAHFKFEIDEKWFLDYLQNRSNH